MFEDLWRHRSLIRAFVDRDLSTRYRSSAVGWLWSLANPLATLVVFSVVFSVLFKMQPPPLGNGDGGNYAAFLFTGIVTWNLFAETVRLSILQLVMSSELLRKVNFPPWAPVLGAGVVQLVQVAIEFCILVLMFVFLRNIGWTLLLAPPILIGLYLFSQGIGLMASVLNARLGDVQYVITIALGTLYFLTPVLYPLSAAMNQSRLFGLALMLNPLTWYVQAMHDVMYTLVAPSPSVVASLLLGGLLVFWTGLTIFDRTSRDIVESL